MSEGQRLNSLDRFRKQSGKLVLEEHAHCEVPAGCGGVVLRWRNPHAAVPFTIHLYTPVRAACFIDRAELRSGRLDLAPGRHVLAIVIENVDLSAGLVMVAAVHEPQKSPGGAIERPLKVTSQDDGTWKFSLEQPPADDWMMVPFDDRDWPALVKAPTPQPGNQDFGAYQCRRCTALGAACLGLPPLAADEQSAPWWQRLLGQAAAPRSLPSSGTIRVRKVFEVIPSPDPDAST